ncbi:HDOD domain-containing protein [Thiocystis violacea]|uniref:HDOD domain-containing protein n=1 Tax=Thiocystis violacea TaxID=13725 RepID=UPI001907B160|nr:HDOD domain-containing protein [Thiocystis violacea]MBK1724536.1 histidine kinase [Thiocystis violacea]
MTTHTKPSSRSSSASLYPSKAALESAFAIARKAKIPQMPDVVLALRKEVNRPEPDLAVAAELIAQDLAMTGLLLKTINSPAFSLATKISSVQQAASLIGLKRLNNLVSAEAVNQLLGPQQGSIRVIWESMLEEARLMAAISHAVPDISDDEAYLYGIMHDAGALIFASLSTDYGSMWSLNSSTPRELLAYEKHTMGVEHTVLGFLLASHWQLPNHIGLAICHHHAPGHLNAEDTRVNHLVALAKFAHYLIALSQGTEELPDMRAYREEAWQDLDISEKDWTDLCTKATEGGFST